MDDTGLYRRAIYGGALPLGVSLTASICAFVIGSPLGTSLAIYASKRHRYNLRAAEDAGLFTGDL